uniref:CpaF family protein n=1 Tax=Desertihabitans aurantiacus TaxID=2282477 RepID=UPI0018E5A4BB
PPDAGPPGPGSPRSPRLTFSAEEVAASPAHAAARAAAPVDWGLVVLLRRQASTEIAEQSRQHAEASGRPMPEVDRRLMGRATIRSIVRRHAEQLSALGQELWPIEVERRYASAVEDAVFGYGRLQPLFDLPGAENIEIHGCDSVQVQYGDGRRVPHPPVADSDEELVEAVRFLGEMASPSRPFDDAHPTMTLALGHRFRLHAIGFGLAHRPSVTIRQHLLTDVTLPQLCDTGLMPDEVGAFLHAAVLARKSVVISGDQGAGKTTLLRAMVSSIPSTERFGTIETDYELLTHLLPGRQNMLALQAKPGLGEVVDGRRLGEFTVSDLIPEALRQNLARLVIGEVRGGEAAAMFEAMQAGPGSLSTTHSRSAGSTIDRLASRVAQGGVLDMDEAYRQIAHNVDLLVHVSLSDDSWRGGVRTRRISEIRQLTGAIEGGRPSTHLVYSASGTGAFFQPDPDFMAELAPFLATWRARPGTAQ